jgi:hypothetical protein
MTLDLRGPRSASSFKAQTAPGFVCHQILRGVELSKENAITILLMGVKAA